MHVRTVVAHGCCAENEYVFESYDRNGAETTLMKVRQCAGATHNTQHAEVIESILCGELRSFATCTIAAPVSDVCAALGLRSGDALGC